MKRLITLAAAAAIMTATTHAQDGYKLVNRKDGAKLTGWVMEQKSDSKVKDDEADLPTFTDDGGAFSTANAVKKDPHLDWSNKHLMLRWVGYLDMGETGGDYTFVAQSASSRAGYTLASCSLKVNDGELINYPMAKNQAEARKTKTVTLNAGLNKVEVRMRTISLRGNSSSLKITYQKKDSETAKDLTPAGLVCEAPID